ncbi:hypothetical protein RUM44_011998 [Polyplax serrata]|uniref:Cathepsin F n=1 Tax=Polyplax serrata TaxID=468196 RepID=A0ABR1BAE9_POLSC
MKFAVVCIFLCLSISVNGGDEIPGGLHEVPVTDPEVQSLSKAALEHINGKKLQGEPSLELVEVVKAKKQIVSGVILEMQLKVTKECFVKVHSQPWLNKLEVLEGSLVCLTRNTIETSLGGHRVLDVKDPDVVRMGQFALSHLNKGKGLGESRCELVEILNATRQVVAGMLTKLTLKVIENGVTKHCHVNILEQLWLNKREVVEAKCESINESSTRITEKRNNTKHFQKDYMMELFDRFIAEHNKVYATKEEYKKKFRIFRANLKKIELLRETEQGTAQYGITKFADMTTKEFKQHLGFVKPQNEIIWPKAEIPDVELPNEFDWRDKNVVTPVKNQEACGSCWAFSVTGNVEGQWALKKGELLSLSEQELVDCDKLDNGCNGGYMTNAYEAIMNLGGLEVESDYPYDAQNEQCHLNKSEIKVKISGGLNLTTDEIAIAKWLYKNGPVSAALNANAMQFYFGGVSHPPKFLCNPENLDHGILIVGFGVHESRILRQRMPFWLIKNSWGNDWGERGYYKLYRGEGTCGINRYVSSAIVN